MVETSLDDCEGLDVVFGQVYEVKVRSIQKIVLKRPRAHPGKYVEPHLAHKDQGLPISFLISSIVSAATSAF
jgi:hypothetical protein